MKFRRRKKYLNALYRLYIKGKFVNHSFLRRSLTVVDNDAELRHLCAFHKKIKKQNKS